MKKKYFFGFWRIIVDKSSIVLSVIMFFSAKKCALCIVHFEPPKVQFDFVLWNTVYKFGTFCEYNSPVSYSNGICDHAEFKVNWTKHNVYGQNEEHCFDLNWTKITMIMKNTLSLEKTQFYLYLIKVFVRRSNAAF